MRDKYDIRYMARTDAREMRNMNRDLLIDGSTVCQKGGRCARPLKVDNDVATYGSMVSVLCG